jgi:Rrf2 family protein
MFKLPRKVEYALMSMQLLNQASLMRLTAKDIAQQLGIPLQITAKTMQQLMNLGFVKSHEGAKGGYTLDYLHIDISLYDFLNRMQEAPSIVKCQHSKIEILQNGTYGKENCEYFEICKIKNSMILIQQKIEKVFKETKLTEII